MGLTEISRSYFKQSKKLPEEGGGGVKVFYLTLNEILRSLKKDVEERK